MCTNCDGLEPETNWHHIDSPEAKENLRAIRDNDEMLREGGLYDQIGNYRAKLTETGLLQENLMFQAILPPAYLDSVIEQSPKYRFPRELGLPPRLLRILCQLDYFIDAVVILSHLPADWVAEWLRLTAEEVELRLNPEVIDDLKRTAEAVYRKIEVPEDLSTLEGENNNGSD